MKYPRNKLTSLSLTVLLRLPSQRRREPGLQLLRERPAGRQQQLPSQVQQLRGL